MTDKMDFNVVPDKVGQIVEILLVLFWHANDFDAGTLGLKTHKIGIEILK